ncbi:ribonuclease T2 [Cognatiyoonia sp. IB215446]|uniref:ribonuclease T2 n=1 Tax=Cognatiyoonia sp. IB215446 TaxID=3097355 RepID=UPI002A17FD5D|nr:ribonuclease T2 [Cognatiyoonia sp. IB215446]MDX8347181.1 ribonuclease T2 [Cognatiyoonia sp. IB215446]
MRVILALLCLIAAPLRAEDRAGVFDYYVLSLSWSANWCAIEGDARNSTQCDAREDFGWILHGLWPQYERGYPEFCPTTARAPSRSDTAAMADIMGTSGLAWHQWRKHGVCTGLSSDDYYALSREAYAQVVRPSVFRRLENTVTLPASVVEEAFLQDNPDLRADQITITCKAGYIQEARICMTRDLQFRTCGADVIRDCAMRDARFDPIR